MSTSYGVSQHKRSSAMYSSGYATLPLHPGKAPRWLFNRMEKLTKEICRVILLEYGSEELLKRLSNPFWFQALSCVIGFDWHSSGTTTTTCGALKSALNKIDDSNERILVAGGKGRTSRKTPLELRDINSSHIGSDFSEEEIDYLVTASRLTAKVDNCVLQDSFQLYHHTFLVDNQGTFTVIQQGMNNKWARRYHWYSDLDSQPSFSEKPREEIASDKKMSRPLDLTAEISESTRKTILDIINDNPIHLKPYLLKSKNQFLEDFFSPETHLNLPKRHQILPRDLGESEFQVLLSLYEQNPTNFDDIIKFKRMGAKKLRALTLVSELVFGSKSSWKDPVKYSFAHGGKDAIPFPVDRKTYDSTIETLRFAIDNSKLKKPEYLKAIKNLNSFAENLSGSIN
ncbi:MAG: DUF763 domain-containing protein [Candidatus Hodarchaeales archaeon]